MENRPGIPYFSLNSALHLMLLCQRHDIMENVFGKGCAEKEIQALVTRAQEGLSDFKETKGLATFVSSLMSPS